MRRFAIIPAAGQSRRMGRPKLTMRWQGKPLITHLLEAWASSIVDQVVVVVRDDDVMLAELCDQAGAVVVQPLVPPPDMKTSVGHGLEKIRQDYSPGDEDYWLLAPADMPSLRATHLNQVMRACDASVGAIVVPVCGGRRGHPAAFPWTLAAEVRKLPEDAGLNRLVAQSSVVELPLQAEEILTDVDTPEDFQQLTDRDQNP